MGSCLLNLLTSEQALVMEQKVAWKAPTKIDGRIEAETFLVYLFLLSPTKSKVETVWIFAEMIIDEGHIRSDTLIVIHN